MNKITEMRFKSLCDTTNLNKSFTILRVDGKHQDYIDENIQLFGHSDVRVMNFDPENLYFLAKSMQDFPIGTLIVMDHLEFFSCPLLVSATKIALKRFGTSGFSVEFTAFEFSTPYGSDEYDCFVDIERVAYNALFNRKAGIYTFELDKLYETHMKLDSRVLNASHLGSSLDLEDDFDEDEDDYNMDLDLDSDDF